MATESKIRISVDDSELNKLRQQAENLARDMIRASREFATGGDEVIADLEEQIRLMERQHRIAEEYARTEIERQRREGQITPQQAQQKVQQVSADAASNRILVDLVREVIDTLKQTSKDEIRADRQDVERQIRQSKTVGQFGPAGDPFTLLRETLQRQYLGLEGQDETAPQTRRPARRRWLSEENRKRASDAFKEIASAQNEYALVAPALRGIPIFGEGLSVGIQRGVQSAEEFQNAAIAYGRISRFNTELSPLERGRTVGRAMGFDAAGQFGLTPAEALRAYTGIESTLMRDVSGSAFGNLVGAQRVLGLDPNTLQQILGTARYDRSINDPSRILAQFDKFTRETGRSITMIPELIGTFTNAANQILTTRGEVDTASLSRVITNMSRQTGFEGVRLQRLTGAFGNLGRTGNPVTRALLMRAFRETDPNASYVDILERMEGGLDEGSRPGLQRFFEIMRERTGGGDALVLALRTALPDLSIKDIRDVIKSGGFAASLQRDQIAGTTDYAARTKDFVSPIEISSKKFATAFELGGDVLVDAIEQLKTKLADAFEFFDIDLLSEHRSPPKPEKTEADQMNEAESNEIVGGGYRYPAPK